MRLPFGPLVFAATRAVAEMSALVLDDVRLRALLPMAVIAGAGVPG